MWILVTFIQALLVLCSQGCEWYTIVDGPLECSGGLVVAETCFPVHTTPMTFEDAEATCRESGGEMAIVEAKQVKRRLFSEFLANDAFPDVDRLMIGALDRTCMQDGRGYTWGKRRGCHVNNHVVGRERGRRGSTMDCGKGRCCTAFVRDEDEGHWECVPCDEPLPFVCSSCRTNDVLAGASRNRNFLRRQEVRARQEAWKFIDPPTINAELGITDVVGGDMKEFDRNQHRRKRNALNNQWHEYYLWQDGVVCYTFESVSEEAKTNIRLAMDEIEARTCIKFVHEQGSTGTCLNFIDAVGCWSYVGYTWLEPQPISIGDRCTMLGTIQHELMHALGFHHEQSRTDRDSFVSILEENIDASKMSNFEKEVEDEIMTQGVPYDITSIMHYGQTYFSTNGENTIVVVSEADKEMEDMMGQRDSMTPLDFYEINALYKCQNVPIDGGWSIWSSYGACSVSCGGGIQQRTRKCNSPEPSNGGAPCQGPSHENRPCMEESCPTPETNAVDYRYMGCFASSTSLPEPVQSLESQSVYTMNEYFTRIDPIQMCALAALQVGAEVFALAEGGKCLAEVKDYHQYDALGVSNKCASGTGAEQAMDVYTLNSDTQIQSHWGNWTRYGTCSAYCGGGTQYRTRECSNPPYVDGRGYIDCVGSPMEGRECNKHECPVDGVYGSWGAWDPCSVDCGQGERTRTRSCSSTAYGGRSCVGDASETEICYGTSCNTNFCNNNDCSANSNCVDGLSSYHCECHAGYQGDRCQTNINECTAGVCNHGSCTDGIDIFSCTCDPGWTGPTCNIDIDYCQNHGCVHGMCQDIQTDYTCVCYQGYTGALCEINIDECAGLPCVNGECVEMIDWSKCYCEDGWTGDSCNQNINDCPAVDPCNNGGKCVDEVRGFSCECGPGFKGTYCDDLIDYCLGVDCQNGGVCQSQTTGYICNCQTGFNGDQCQNNIDDCVTHACENGAQCLDRVAGYDCQCGPGFSGPRCQTNDDECAAHQCENGAVCQDGVNGYTCQCAAGFSGELCQTNDDECAAHQCENGAVCQDGVNGYTCQCAAGFSGEFCQTNDDECAAHQCENAALCQDGVNGYTCQCAPGFSGEFCRTNDDECAAHQCENGAVCQDGVNGYTCQCALGFSGEFCQTNDDECAAHQCENGAVCQDGVNGYTCQCAAGFSGEFCQTNDDECIAHQCENGAVCQDGVNGYTCQCAPGISGEFCQTNDDECISHQCENGAVCQDGVNGYTCQCAPGFSGEFCQTNDDECAAHQCENAAVCQDGVNGYTCQCAAGFSGEFCQTNDDECTAHQCENEAVCQDGVNGYTCQCAPGFSGEFCQTNDDECAAHQCENAAVCQDGVNGYTCQCAAGFSGEFCQTNDNECTAHQCENAAVCQDGVNGYTCQCAPGFSGEFCQTNDDECAAHQCENAAVCQDGVNGYTCQCAAGFSGEFCQTNDDECTAHQCENAAVCQDGVNGYTCQCAPGFSGEFCQTNDDECAAHQCENAAVCQDGVNGYTCQCAAGFSGEFCQTNDDECTAHQCENAAVCQDGVNGYTCQCAPGFSGEFCQTNDDDCANIHCVNGYCDDQVNGYVCQCLLGFSGLHCEINDDECAAHQCENGAVCQDGVNGYTCQCAPGFSGEFCQTNDDECVNHACENGAVCQDGINTYTCRCAEGFSGEFCQINDDECMGNGCMHGSQCVDGINGYSCICRPGYEGDLCEININECLMNDCQNGAVCINGINVYSCQCAPGYEGVLCDIDTDDCAHHECQNNAICEDGINTYSCVCPEGVIGEKCETISLDGGWSYWSDWSDCSADCGPGTMSRDRQCDRPTPVNGADCVGPSVENQDCNLQPCVSVDGGWSYWSDWSECSADCGPGTMSRDRQCDRPTPVNGADCMGPSLETQSCSLKPCELNCPAPSLTFNFKFSAHSLFTPVGSGVTQDEDANIGSYAHISTGSYIEGRATSTWGACITHPETCTGGMSMSLWIYQSQADRDRASMEGPNIILSSGVEADGAVTDKNGLGIVLYTRHSAPHILMMWLRTRTREYTADIPTAVFQTDTWTHVGFTWSATHGLEMFYKGRPIDNDVTGRENQNPGLDAVYDTFIFGKPVACYDHYHAGSYADFRFWDQRISRDDMYCVFASARSHCAMCDTSSTCVLDTCVCQGPFQTEDDYTCTKVRDTTVDPADAPSAPVYVWSMDDMAGNPVLDQDWDGQLVSADQFLLGRGVYGQAIYFNGRRDWFSAGDYAGKCLSAPDNCPDDPAGRGLTIVFWIRFYGRGEQYGDDYILSSGGQPSSAENTGTGVSMYHAAGQLRSVVQTSTERYENVLASGLQRATWTHVALVWTSSELTVYLNGQTVGISSVETKSEPNEGFTVMSIGKRNDLDVEHGRFDMDELLMFNKPLTLSQIQCLMRKGWTN